MKISFDLDGVLLLSRYDDPEKMEPEPKSFLARFYKKDRLRKGTPELVHELHRRGFEVWIYTSSGRTVRYLNGLFRLYGIRFDDIVNMQRHEAEVQKGRPNRYPTKMPCKYKISLHVDDEEIVKKNGLEYGFKVFLLKKDNTNWVQDIIDCAERIRALEEKQNGPEQN